MLKHDVFCRQLHFRGIFALLLSQQCLYFLRVTVLPQNRAQYTFGILTKKIGDNSERKNEASKATYKILGRIFVITFSQICL